MSEWIKIAEIAGRLTVSLVGWIVSLVEAGQSPEEAEGTIRTEIEDRRAEIAAKRAANDEAIKRKHGVE